MPKPSAEPGSVPYRMKADDPTKQPKGADVAAQFFRHSSFLRARTRATLRIIRSNPTGRIALKIIIGLVGGLVVLTGLALIPLPGPGWALVILGLAILAIEFVWAKHLLRFTRARVQQWTRWVKRQSWPVRALLGLVGMIFVGAVLVVSLKYSLGIDVMASFWTYVTTH